MSAFHFSRLFALPLRAAPAARTYTPMVLPPLPSTLRHLHPSKMHTPRLIPLPIPLIPDVPTFLRVIGRDLHQYADKFPTWDSLFTLTSEQLRELGIEPARSRKYLLSWLEKYRNGLFGPGGDFKHVKDGKAKLVVAHDLATDLKKVVNVPMDGDAGSPEAVPVRGYRVKGAATVSGPYALPKGRWTAILEVTDRMWEFRQGKKVDGGERRKVMIRFKRRVAERKARREGEMV